MAFGKQPSAAQAVQENMDAILLLLKASAPVEYHQMLRECAVQAHGNDSLVKDAVDQLLASRAIAREWIGPVEIGDEGYFSYELPDASSSATTQCVVDAER